MIVALTGLTGSGKTTVADFFKDKGFQYFRFGQVTIDNLTKKGLPINEANERAEREAIRNQYGMGGFAKLAVPILEKMLKSGPVLADNMMSFEEYTLLKDYFKDQIQVVSVQASPETRTRRIATRTVRPYTPEETRSRDLHEIEVLHKGGTIAMADITVINEGSVEELNEQLKQIYSKLGVEE
ncbi:MAG: AAA family ATPase [Candidatus Woesearchaeota archaeon]